MGSGEEVKNIDTIRLLLQTLDVSLSGFEFVKDRPGHDIRYSLSSRKLINNIGWKPKVKFREGIRLAVEWSLKNKDWLLLK